MNTQSLRTVGSYELLEEIGAGGMSRVYRARKTGSGEDVAIKVIHIENVEDDFERRMRREPDIQGGIAHENIVRLIDYFRVAGEFFLVMEYVDGRSLASIIHQEPGPLPFERARGYFRQLLRAVDQLHRLGIIHRDIKPSNVLINSHDVVKLADFGIAKFAWQQGQTQTQHGLGTPEYMSPEQARGAMIDHRTDIFSLGVTFFEILTGRKPFARDDKTPMGYVSVIQDVINKPLPDPRTINPSVPAAAVMLMNKATAKNPLERFQSCSEFLGALELIDERDQSEPTMVFSGADRERAMYADQESRRPHIPFSERMEQRQAQPQQVRPQQRKSRTGLWIAILFVILGGGGYAFYQYWTNRPHPAVTGPAMTKADAMRIAQKVAEDIKDYGENNPQGYASLFAERDVEYLTVKSTTRKDIESKRRSFLKGIVSTEKFDISVKDARPLNDSTVEAEIVMDYSRTGKDGTTYFGSTSSFITIRNFDGRWLITSYRRNWDNSQKSAAPKDTSHIDTTHTNPTSTVVQPPPTKPDTGESMVKNLDSINKVNR